MRSRSLLRFAEGGLLLASFGGLSLYAVFAQYAEAIQRSRGSELEEVLRGARRPALVSEGALVGRIEVPRLRLSAVVLEGVSEATLRIAAGHVPGTALPGEGGNSAIAAHRDSFFRGLKGIRPGDRIVVTTPAGRHEYRVSGTAIVSPRDRRVLKPTVAETLTLVTCFPFHYLGSAPERFIVRATRAAD